MPKLRHYVFRSVWNASTSSLNASMYDWAHKSIRFLGIQVSTGNGTAHVWQGRPVGPRSSRTRSPIRTRSYRNRDRRNQTARNAITAKEDRWCMASGRMDPQHIGKLMVGFVTLLPEQATYKGQCDTRWLPELSLFRTGI